MGLREDIIDMKEEIREVQKQSFALEMLKDSKQANKRIAISFAVVLIIVSTFWFLTMVYLIHTLNDIGSITETNTQEINDVDRINGNVVNRGDIYGDYKANERSQD